ncbi:MAG: NAD-dependent epimerase/dehydratase family protein [Bacteroidota bacterium]
MAGRSALLVGASGLVGGHALRILAQDGRWSRVVTLDRRPLAVASERHEPHVVDFTALDEIDDERFACDDVFCCLGTTIKAAGSQEAFRWVDLELPAAIGHRARSAGATQMLLVSAYGADTDSRIFYNRTKGEAEDAISDLGFASVQILRPSLLAGDRQETRVGERIGLAVFGALRPLLVGPLAPFRPTPAESVARMMVAVAARRSPGVHVYGPQAIASGADGTA